MGMLSSPISHLSSSLVTSHSAVSETEIYRSRIRTIPEQLFLCTDLSTTGPWNTHSYVWNLDVADPVLLGIPT